MNNNIKIAKLITSEFIIARLIENMLTNIVLIKFNINQLSGDITKVLVPYMSPLTTSVGHIIPIDKVITMESANDELIGLYVNFLKNILSQEQSKLEKEKNAESDGVSESNT